MSGKRRRGTMTAKELMEQLQRDPEFVAAEERREQRRQERMAESKAAAAPLVAELRALGFDVQSVSDLFHRRMDYRAAIPVLMDWLPKAPNRNVQEAIVRALSVPWAKSAGAALLLVQQFGALDDDTQSSVRWVIGNAPEVIADDQVFEDLAELARDRRYGRAREMLVMALGNMRHRRNHAVEVLLELLVDEDVAGHAVVALGRLRAAEARPALEPFLDHPNSWIRQEVKEALAKIDR